MEICSNPPILYYGFKYYLKYMFLMQLSATVDKEQIITCTQFYTHSTKLYDNTVETCYKEIWGLLHKTFTREKLWLF